MSSPAAFAIRSCARRATPAGPASIASTPARTISPASIAAARSTRSYPVSASPIGSTGAGSITPTASPTASSTRRATGANTSAELGRQFPADAAGLKALFEEIKAIYDGMYAERRRQRRNSRPAAQRRRDARLRPQPSARRAMDGSAVRRARRAPCRATREAKRLLKALTGYVSDGREPLSCAAMVPLFGYYFDGGYYPAGGSERLARSPGRGDRGARRNASAARRASSAFSSITAARSASRSPTATARRRDRGRRQRRRQAHVPRARRPRRAARRLRRSRSPPLRRDRRRSWSTSASIMSPTAGRRCTSSTAISASKC